MVGAEPRLVVETPPPIRQRYEARSGIGEPIVVGGTNWLYALGAVLVCFGIDEVPGRLGAETLPNGNVIAHDTER